MHFYIGGVSGIAKLLSKYKEMKKTKENA